MSVLQFVRENHIVNRLCLAGTTFVIGVLCVVISITQPKIEVEVSLCFTLCIVSMLVLSYQSLLPRWTRRMSSKTILLTCAAMDSLSTILWTAAFISVVAWISRDTLAGPAEQSHATASCSNFANGTVLTCRLGKATSVLAAFLCVLFLVIACVSVGEAIRYFQTGELPHRLRTSDSMDLVDQEGDAWSVVILDDQDRKGNHGRIGSREDHEDGRFTIMQSTDTSDGRHPGRKISYVSQKNVDYEIDLTPSALSPMDRSPVALMSRMGTLSRL